MTAMVKWAPSASVQVEAGELPAILARDEATWRLFVARVDPPLRAVVRQAVAFSDDQVDDVMGDFWLAVVADNMRILHAFDPSHGASLLSWLSFHVAQVASEHVRRRTAQPEVVPLHDARNVPARSTVDDAIRAAVREAMAEERRQVANVRQPASAANPTEYLSADRAAEIAGVRPPTIREWVARGKLPGHRAGRLLRVRLDELQRFLAGTPSGRVDVEARKRKALAKLK